MQLFSTFLKGFENVLHSRSIEQLTTNSSLRLLIFFFFFLPITLKYTVYSNGPQPLVHGPVPVHGSFVTGIK